MWSWLSRLFAPPPRPVPLCIWLTAAARDRAVCQAARRAAEQGAAVIVLACFRDQLLATAEAMEAAGVAYELWHPGPSLDGVRRELQGRRGGVLLTLVELLPRPESEPCAPAGPAITNAPSKVALLGTELHPLPEEDSTLLAIADALADGALIVHVSLDDAIVRRFAGGSVQEILQKLGMTEVEAIESRLVARQFMQARQKLARSVCDHQPAGSADDWLRRNVAAE